MKKGKFVKEVLQFHVDSAQKEVQSRGIEIRNKDLFSPPNKCYLVWKPNAISYCIHLRDLGHLGYSFRSRLSHIYLTDNDAKRL